MHIEVVAVGNELLEGFIVNTNTTYISRALLSAGFEVNRQICLPDHKETLKAGLLESLERSHVVIATGGLGATDDDCTREVAASIFSVKMKLNQELLERLQKRYGIGVPSLENQATVPENSSILPNEWGTASGLILTKKYSLLILLPGVPFEMQQLVDQEVIPFLHTLGAPSLTYRKSFHFFQLNELAVNEVLCALKREFPPLCFGIYPSLGTLSLHICVKASEKDAAHLFQEVEKEIRKKFSAHLFEAPSGKLEEALHHKLATKGLSLSLAESCTGGAIAAKLVKIPGASRFLQGSFVTYSNALKTKILGVPESLIAEKGAVSEEVAYAMAQGAMNLSGSDIALAVSGLAGPEGGTAEKPVGTVTAAFCSQIYPAATWTFHKRGSRESIIEFAVYNVLAECFKRITF